jgi:hypothetical protein
MDENRVEGIVRKASGKLQEGVDRLTGDAQTLAEGLGHPSCRDRPKTYMAKRLIRSKSATQYDRNSVVPKRPQRMPKFAEATFCPASSAQSQQLRQPTAMRPASALIRRPARRRWSADYLGLSFHGLVLVVPCRRWLAVGQHLCCCRWSFQTCCLDCNGTFPALFRPAVFGLDSCYWPRLLL